MCISGQLHRAKHVWQKKTCFRMCKKYMGSVIWVWVKGRVVYPNVGNVMALKEKGEVYLSPGPPAISQCPSPDWHQFKRSGLCYLSTAYCRWRHVFGDHYIQCGAQWGMTQWVNAYEAPSNRERVHYSLPATPVWAVPRDIFIDKYNIALFLSGPFWISYVGGREHLLAGWR